MKSRPSRALFVLLLAFALAILPGLQPVTFGQSTDAKSDAPPSVPVAEKAPAPTEPVEPPAPVAPAAPAATAVETDKPVDDKAAVEASSDASKVTSEKAEEAEPEPTNKEEGKKGKHLRSLSDRRHRGSDNARVSVFQGSVLEAGAEADAVISIFGSSTSAGSVRGPVVSVIGSSTSSGEVGDNVVSVLGGTKVTGGTVNRAVVSVLGSTYVNGHVKGEVVAVFGNVELGPLAEVDGQLVCVGGEVIRDPKSVLHGNVQNVAFGGHRFLFEGLTAWVTKCLLYARPLAFGPNLMWAWWIALAYLGVYLLVALIAPGTVIKCVRTLEERPGKSILAGLLTMLLTPVIYVLLALTVFIVIGVALIPLFSLGLFFAGIMGKVVMLAWLGRRVTKLVDAESKAPAILVVLIGGAIVLLLYTVPVLGFIVYKLLGILGLGVVVYTLLLSIKSNRPPAAKTSSAMPMGTAVSAAAGDFAGGSVAVSQLPPVISATTLPRAGFWIRLGATLLDVVLVGAVFGMLDGVFGWFFKITGSFPLWFAVYNVAMWATKGTTIGGIICGLKVVRIDDRPIDWGVAVVRALGAFLSLAVAGLGFIWVAFDDDRQSWHDKVAGTTIVRVPKGTSLI